MLVGVAEPKQKPLTEHQEREGALYFSDDVQLLKVKQYSFTPRQRTGDERIQIWVI